MSRTHSNNPGKCCRRCHFLEDRLRDDGGGEWPSLVDEATRNQLGNSAEKARGFAKSRNFACHQGVWNYANLDKDTQDEFLSLLNQDRGESCLFYPYTRGMLFPAAENLERREADRREARRDRKWAKVGVWVAAIALTLNLAWDVCKYCWSDKSDSKPALKCQDSPPPAAVPPSGP